MVKSLQKVGTLLWIEIVNESDKRLNESIETIK